jgi:hypothetical protein
MFDDRWWQWIVDFGLPGPDRDEGGRFLLVPLGLRRPAARQRVPHRALAHDESVLARPGVHGQRRPGADRRANQAHDFYAYAQGGFGTSIAALLEGQVDSWCRHLNNHRSRVMARPYCEASIAGMVIALLAVLGVDLIVIVAFFGVVLSRRRWVSRQPGAFKRRGPGGGRRRAGLGPKWQRGYGRRVRDVLVWTKAALLAASAPPPARSGQGCRPGSEEAWLPGFTLCV